MAWNKLWYCVILCVSAVWLASADFDCVCNYNVETPVYGQPSKNVTPIGYLYEFDCKPLYSGIQQTKHWFTIGFEGNIGFASADDQLQQQVCPGVVPDLDKVDGGHTANTSVTASPEPYVASALNSTTGTHTQTTPPMSSPTIEVFTFGSPVVVTTSTVEVFTFGTTPGVSSDGDTTLCATNLFEFARSHSGHLGQYGSSCYVVVTRPDHWATAERTCQSYGGHLVSVNDQPEQNFLVSFLGKNYNHHSAWIGLNDGAREGHFEWTSGQPVNYVNWAPNTDPSIVHSMEDCGVIDTRNLQGHWDDRDCGIEINGYICEFNIGGANATTMPTTMPTVVFSASDGDTSLCPANVRQHASANGGILGQNERACFELLPNNRYNWEHAESTCTANGGHLLYITSQADQTFVQGFLTRHIPTKAVWLGLNDRQVEGTFTWTSGVRLSYENWLPNRELQTFLGPGAEDCVVMVPYKQGVWDDVPCGFDGFLGQDGGETHFVMCRYKTAAPSAIIGK